MTVFFVAALVFVAVAVAIVLRPLLKSNAPAGIGSRCCDRGSAGLVGGPTRVAYGDLTRS